MSSYLEYPACACGGETAIDWSGCKAPATDVFGSPQYSDATGLEHSSQREKVKHMKKWGFEEAGDPEGGMRKVHKLEGTGFSFPGQTNYRTLREGA
jgi:hypothetical protein